MVVFSGVGVFILRKCYRELELDFDEMGLVFDKDDQKGENPWSFESMSKKQKVHNLLKKSLTLILKSFTNLQKIS